MGVGGGGAQLTEGVGGGGGSDLSLQPTVVSLAGVAKVGFSTESRVGVVSWVEP